MFLDEIGDLSLALEVKLLRERRGDVLPLARQFIAVHGACMSALKPRLAPEPMGMCGSPVPGAVSRRGR